MVAPGSRRWVLVAAKDLKELFFFHQDAWKPQKLSPSALASHLREQIGEIDWLDMRSRFSQWHNVLVHNGERLS